MLAPLVRHTRGRRRRTPLGEQGTLKALLAKQSAASLPAAAHKLSAARRRATSAQGRSAKPGHTGYLVLHLLPWYPAKSTIVRLALSAPKPSALQVQVATLRWPSWLDAHAVARRRAWRASHRR